MNDANEYRNGQPQEITLAALEDAIEQAWRESPQRTPRKRVAAEAIYPLMLQHAAWVADQWREAQP